MGCKYLCRGSHQSRIPPQKILRGEINCKILYFQSIFPQASRFSLKFPNLLMWQTPILTRESAEFLTNDLDVSSPRNPLFLTLALIISSFLLGSGPTMMPVSSLQEEDQTTFLYAVFPWELSLGLGMFVYLVKFMAPASVSSRSALSSWSTATLLIWGLHLVISLPRFGIGVFPVPFVTMTAGCLGLIVAFGGLAICVTKGEVPKRQFKAGSWLQAKQQRCSASTNADPLALSATFCLIFSAFLGLLWLALTLNLSDSPYSPLTALLYEVSMSGSKLRSDELK